MLRRDALREKEESSPSDAAVHEQDVEVPESAKHFAASVAVAMLKKGHKRNATQAELEET